MGGRPMVENLQRSVGFSLRGAGVLLLLASAHGCSTAAGPTHVAEGDSTKNLQQIGAAYSQAAFKLGRPPATVDDLKEFLNNSPGNPDPATVLKSPDDNENYVIVWGVDFRELAKSSGNVDVVLAYEQRGTGGKRHVLKPPSIVVVMTDEQFKTARFPPGHQPAP